MAVGLSRQAYIYIANVTVTGCPEGVLWLVAQCVLLNAVTISNNGGGSGNTPVDSINSVCCKRKLL
jgi:hypothetical protein